MSIYEEYVLTLASGKFWEEYPQLTGLWDMDWEDFVEIVSIREGKKV